MNLPKHSLFDLVKSMTKSEKRYFKMYNPSSKELNYILYFDFLDKLEEFDEDKIEAFLEKNFSKQLRPSIRVYLLKKILFSLKNYNNNSTKDKEKDCHNLFNSGKVLFRKGLKKESMIYLAKAEGIAKKYELHVKYLEIQDFRLNHLISSHYSDSKGFSAIDKLYQSQQNLLETHINLRTFKYFYSKVFYYYIRAQRVDEELLGIVNQELLADVKKAKSFLAVYCFYNTRAFLSELGYLDISTLEQFKLVYDAWADKPHMAKQYFPMYLNSFTNYLNALMFNGDNELVYSLLDEFKDLPAKVKPYVENSSFVRAEVFGHYYYCLTSLLLKERKCEKLLFEVPIIECGLEKFQQHMGSIVILRIFQNIGYTYFIEKKYDSVINWINRTCDHFEMDVYTLTLKHNHALGALYMIVNYELDNWKFLKYELEKFVYRLSKGNLDKTKMPIFELINLIRLLIGKRYTGKSSILFERYNEIFNKFRKLDESGDRSNNSLELIDLWFETKKIGVLA